MDQPPSRNRPVGQTNLLGGERVLTANAPLTNTDNYNEGEWIAPQLYRELKASEERYRSLINNLLLPLWQIDSRVMTETFAPAKPFGDELTSNPRATSELLKLVSSSVVVTAVNDSAVALLRAANKEDLVGPVGYLFAASPDTVTRIALARFTERPSHIEEMKLRAFDGQILDVLLFVTFPQTRECPDLALLMMVDVSVQRRTEQELRRVQADFAHASRVSALGELVATIAHEVRQPLSVIATDADTGTRWLDREEPNLSKVKALMTRIMENAHRANQVISRVQDMTVKRDPVRRPVDINAIVQEALTFVSIEARAQAVDISSRLQHGLPNVLGDRIQLQQVIVNLLLNGIQAISHAGTDRRQIVVETSYGLDEVIMLSVEDTGGGIASDHLSRIFDGFFSTKVDGVGIGLAICRFIVADHEGAISVENEEGVGARFLVTLPAISD